MPQGPYAPPVARVDDPQLPPRPKQVTTGVSLLWTSFFLGFPGLWLAASRDPETVLNPASILFVVLFMFLVASVNVQTYRGRNWARIASLVFVLLSVGLTLAPPPEPVPPSAIENALTVICLVLDVVAMYFLFSKPAARWFRPERD